MVGGKKKKKKKKKKRKVGDRSMISEEDAGSNVPVSRSSHTSPAPSTDHQQ
jgi:hypothetical protein